MRFRSGKKIVSNEQDENQIWVLIHTMTITESGYRVSAQFIHALLRGFQNFEGTRLLSRRVRMSISRNLAADNSNKNKIHEHDFSNLRTILKRNSGLIKHHIRTLMIDSSSSKSSPIPSQSSANQAGVVSFSPLKQAQQPIVQIVAPLQQVQVAQEPKQDIQMVDSRDHIRTTSSTQDVKTWLLQNRFQKFVEMFQDYNGHDLLRLSRDDLIQICGETEGIRFFNVLHDRAIDPRTRIYIRKDNTNVFHAVFLIAANKEDLKQELCALVGLRPIQVQVMYLEGPNNIHVIVSNTVVYHFKDESAFAVEIIKEKDHLALLLKPLKTA